MKIFYHKVTGDSHVFEDDARVEDWPEHQVEPSIAAIREAALHERLLLLHQTDVWALVDRKMTEAQLEYRQALRDITTQHAWREERYGDVVWPLDPTELEVLNA